jgi:hypothetical protein
MGGVKLALNQAEAAEALGIDVKTFRKNVRPYIKRRDIGSRMLFPVSELQAWLTKDP